MGDPSQPDRLRAHVWISGQVQGVNFRVYAEDEATFRKVSGWIRNTPEGRVEAIFEGDRPSVEAMIRWCHRGSPASHVRGVEVIWEPPREVRSFRVRS